MIFNFLMADWGSGVTAVLDDSGTDSRLPTLVIGFSGDATSEENLGFIQDWEERHPGPKRYFFMPYRIS